jgi:hypothetical protein
MNFSYSPAPKHLWICLCHLDNGQQHQKAITENDAYNGPQDQKWTQHLNINFDPHKRTSDTTLLTEHRRSSGFIYKSVLLCLCFAFAVLFTYNM